MIDQLIVALKEDASIPTRVSRVSVTIESVRRLLLAETEKHGFIRMGSVRSADIRHFALARKRFGELAKILFVQYGLDEGERDLMCAAEKVMDSVARLSAALGDVNSYAFTHAIEELQHLAQVEHTLAEDGELLQIYGSGAEQLDEMLEIASDVEYRVKQMARTLYEHYCLLVAC